MKKNLLTLATILTIGFFTNNAMAQTSAEVSTTTAGAKLIKPMTLVQDSPLHFGTINVLAGAGGTVVMNSDSNSRTFSSGVASGIVAPAPTNAAYTVTGTKNVTYALTLPTTIVVAETLVPANTMTISALKARFNGESVDAVTSTLSATGTDSFTVGGTLTVAASQNAGIYAATFKVSVDYN
ncbi:DUF4402 domain-containing protein [Flavobacterium degerlachei]|uniref:DUF4402 domain-containing protein n=1 Tax=Flavobacterium degerlachei TaxID=229203 RepID=A0A1H2ZES5_9FLAO|nr:DUF4402 domain-containing protein [Flavobacterium degerlachei]SDX15837.1 protein of unknown function [Flavobacterium degerlachei]